MVRKLSKELDIPTGECDHSVRVGVSVLLMVVQTHYYLCFLSYLYSVLWFLLLVTLSLSANFPEDVVAGLPQSLSCGVYYGWARVDEGPTQQMVMSIGWNPQYMNDKKSMVCSPVL